MRLLYSDGSFRSNPAVPSVLLSFLVNVLTFSKASFSFVTVVFISNSLVLVDKLAINSFASLIVLRVSLIPFPAFVIK